MTPATTPAELPNVLARIVAHKHHEVAAAQQRRPWSQLESELSAAPPIRDFVAALTAAPWMGLIAEVKRASPSAGIIQADFDPLETARQYIAGGAHCLSILTDEQFFHGHLDFLRQIRALSPRPCLRKDFIIDPYQVLEARVAGADAVLLIAECLDDAALSGLYRQIRELGMQALIEVYDVENVARVMALHPPLIGVNNRDLRTFDVDLKRTGLVADRLPKRGDDAPALLLVSESGLKTRADVEQVRSVGARAILVGETLMRSASIAATIAELTTPPPSGDAR
jgi:indole-3-glycerol phosphate synthase